MGNLFGEDLSGRSCSVCGEFKSHAEFRWHSFGKRQSHRCKACEKTIRDNRLAERSGDSQIVKACVVCHEQKPSTDFAVNNRTSDGLHSNCRKCFKRRKDKWYKNNPKCRLVGSARQRARENGLQFTITVDDFEIPERCPILGIPLIVNIGKHGPTANSPTLDRVIPKLGYVKENIVVISHRANRLKNDGDLNDFLALVRFMSEREGLAEKPKNIPHYMMGA